MGYNRVIKISITDNHVLEAANAVHANISLDDIRRILSLCDSDAFNIAVHRTLCAIISNDSYKDLTLPKGGFDELESTPKG
jgi:hypothetical protein